MRFGAVVPVMNEWRFMLAVVGQLAQVCDRVLVLRGRKALSGADAVPCEIPQSLVVLPKVEIVEGMWDSEHDTRNFGMGVLPDCDYVFTVDSDEIFSVDALRFLKETCEKTRLRVIACKMHTYWKTIRYRIDPPEQLVAPVVIRADTRFQYLRQADIRAGEACLVNRHCMHHLSYVRTDEEVREKLRLFGHAKEVVPGWYERVWRRWDENKRMRNLHPTHPPAYREAIPAGAEGVALREILGAYALDLEGLA